MDAKPSSHDLIDRVRAAIAHLPDVQEKKMFGSTGFMIRGHLCVSARADRIRCRIDPATHVAAIGRKGCSTVVMKGSRRIGYVYVAAAELGTKVALNKWLKAALAFNETLAG